MSISSLIHNLCLVQINYEDKQLTNQTLIKHTKKQQCKKNKKKMASYISMTNKDCDTMLWVERLGSRVCDSLLYSQISDLFVPTHTSGTSLHPSVHVGKFRLKAGWHRCRKKLENRNISGGLGGVEVTDVKEKAVFHRLHEEEHFLPVWKLLLQTVHRYTRDIHIYNFWKY